MLVRHAHFLWAGGSKAEIKIAGRNINNLRYVEDTTLMAESEEELKGLLMKVNFRSSFWTVLFHFGNTAKDSQQVLKDVYNCSTIPPIKIFM